MHVALLAPAASIQSYPAEFAFAQYRAVVAINRAAVMHRCDYWCALDPEILEHHQPIGSCVTGFPAVVTSQATFTTAFGRTPTPPKWIDFSARQGMPDPGIGWARFSGTLGLAFAASLLPPMPSARRVIDCYGVDFSHVAADADGVTLASYRRGADRWAEERPIWDRLVAYLASQNIAVVRYGRADAPADLRTEETTAPAAARGS